MLHNAWRNELKNLRDNGEVVGPRGIQTREILHTSLVLDPRYSLIDVPERNLNYRFAVAEWVWMLFGHSDVASIAQYNGVMRNFSDDNMFLTGAYGPHICAQRDATIQKLKDDPSTRQAVIEILRPRRRTKDEPCTLSFQFLLRKGALNMIATMRSNDIWLGTPYDAYTFSQIQNCFAGALGVDRGWLSIRAGSLHLYESDIDKVHTVLQAEPGTTLRNPALPGFPPQWLDDVFRLRRADCVPQSHAVPADELDAWFPYASVLLSSTSDEARAKLRML